MLLAIDADSECAEAPLDGVAAFIVIFIIPIVDVVDVIYKYICIVNVFIRPFTEIFTLLITT